MQINKKNEKLVIIGIIFLMHQWINASTQTIVVNQAGVYNYRSDIIGTPTAANSVLIEIAASNVIFDFQGYALSQDPSNTFTNFCAIVVDPNLTDVTIQNGTISNITGTGVVIRDGCSNIVLNNLFINGCQAAGIAFNGVSGINEVIVENCVISSCTGAQGGPAMGLSMTKVNNFIINNCDFINNNANTGNPVGFGASIQSSQFGQLTNCIASGNGSNVQAVGIFLSNCNNILLSECQAVQNAVYSSSPGASVVGFGVQQCTQINIFDSTSIQNNSAHQVAEGFFLSTGTANILQNCLAQGNTGGTQAIGIHLSGQTSAGIFNCISQNNNTTVSGSAYGILIDNIATTTLCLIQDNRVFGNNALSGFGIQDQMNPSSNVYMRNQAFNNGTNYSITYPSSIVLPRIIGSLSNNLVGLPHLQAGDLDNVDVTP